jgi:hypothetical protein
VTEVETINLTQTWLTLATKDFLSELKDSDSKLLSLLCFAAASSTGN